MRDHQRWQFAHATQAPQSVDVQPGIFLDTTLAVREAVCQGAEISVLPDYVVANDLAAGGLLQVLPQWQLPSGGIHAVFPATRFRPAKVRAFVELLLEQTAQQHGL